MPSKKRNNRGFREFVEAENVRVCESSLAFEGPHVWIFGGRIVANDGSRGVVHLSVAQAEIALRGLEDFLREARAGELKEVIR